VNLRVIGRTNGVARRFGRRRSHQRTSDEENADHGGRRNVPGGHLDLDYNDVERPL
jgi:hypothetical protein